MRLHATGSKFAYVSIFTCVSKCVQVNGASLPLFDFTQRKDKCASYLFTTEKIDTQYVSGFFGS